MDPSVLAGGFNHEAFSDPGYHDPHARLKAMDRDGVDAEVLYSEVSAFRNYPFMKPGLEGSIRGLQSRHVGLCLG